MSILVATSLRNRLETHPPTVLKSAFVHMWTRLDMTVPNNTSFNLSSMFDNGVGTFLPTFIASLINGGWAGEAVGTRVVTHANSIAQLDSRTAWGCRLAMVESSAVVDSPNYHAVAMGTLA